MEIFHVTNTERIQSDYAKAFIAHHKYRQVTKNHAISRPYPVKGYRTGVDDSPLGGGSGVNSVSIPFFYGHGTKMYGFDSVPKTILIFLLACVLIVGFVYIVLFHALPTSVFRFKTNLNDFPTEQISLDELFDDVETPISCDIEFHEAFAPEPPTRISFQPFITPDPNHYILEGIEVEFRFEDLFPMKTYRRPKNHD